MKKSTINIVVMVQAYFVSVVYLLFASCLLLVDKYGSRMLFLINLQSFYNSKKQIPIIFMVLGFLLAVVLVIKPMEPGPMVLGDFIPAVNILVLIFYFLKNYNKGSGDVVHFNNPKKNALGYVTLGVSVIHFMFPKIVLL